MFEKMHAKAVATDSDLVRCFFEAFNEIPGEEDQRSVEVPELALSVADKALTDADRESLFMYGISTGGVWSELFRRRMLFDNNLFFPENIAFEDNYFQKIMLFYVERCTFVKEHLYHYRIHLASTMNTRNAPWLLDRLRIECMVLDDIAKEGPRGTTNRSGRTPIYEDVFLEHHPFVGATFRWRLSRRSLARHAA